MFTHFKISHISGKYKLVDINTFSIGDLIVISEFYKNRKNYEIETIMI
jgi:hypothetical protein